MRRKSLSFITLVLAALGGNSACLCYNSRHIKNGMVAITMKLNREAKNLLAMMALTLAIALALNAQLTPAGSRDMWSWTVGLLALAIALWLWSRRDSQAQGDADEAESLAQAAEALAKRAIVRHADDADLDDLTRVNGVGEVFQTVLREAGITSYSALANTSLDKLEAIFTAAGRSRPSRLETWPRQAEFAAQGDWEGLRSYLESLQD